MGTTPEEKIWTVATAVADGYEIAPSQDRILLHLKPLSKVVSNVELKQILTKFEQDEKIIEIRGRPEDL